jgi:pyruvate kinase
MCAYYAVGHKQVATEKHKRIAYLLDTKGPEIRTAMVRGGKNIDLDAGQEVTLVAVGDAYETWEGFKDTSTGVTISCVNVAVPCPRYSLRIEA